MPRGARPSAPQGDSIHVVFLGTSLTEGLGLEAPATQAWPSRIAESYREAGRSATVVNAGLGGETSAGALRRLDWILRQAPDILVVETGANDGLRGLPVDQLEENLDAIVREAGEARPEMPIVVVGMEAPPNMGPAYATAFRAVFERVARRHGTALIPFLLDGVAGDPSLNQADGIHPTVEGHRIMARHAWPVLDSLVAELSPPGTPGSR